MEKGMNNVQQQEMKITMMMHTLSLFSNALCRDAPNDPVELHADQPLDLKTQWQWCPASAPSAPIHTWSDLNFPDSSVALILSLCS